MFHSAYTRLLFDDNVTIIGFIYNIDRRRVRWRKYSSLHYHNKRLKVYSRVVSLKNLENERTEKWGRRRKESSRAIVQHQRLICQFVYKIFDSLNQNIFSLFSLYFLESATHWFIIQQLHSNKMLLDGEFEKNLRMSESCRLEGRISRYLLWVVTEVTYSLHGLMLWSTIITDENCSRIALKEQ